MNPFETKSIFSWNLPAIGLTADAVADKLLSAGFESVMVKVADGPTRFNASRLAWPTWGENAKPDFLARLRERGLKVIGWAFNYGIDIPGELRIAVEQSKRLPLDGYIFDVEGKFEGYTNAKGNAEVLAGGYKRALPDMPTAFCSWSFWKSPISGAQWHNMAVAQAFMKYCDYGMPMMYWQGDTAQAAGYNLTTSLAQWRELITKKPIIPVGRAYNGDGGTMSAGAVSYFASQARLMKCPGLTWWVLDKAAKNPEVWGALTAIPKYQQSEPPAPEPREVGLVEWAVCIDEWARAKGYDGPAPTVPSSI